MVRVLITSGRILEFRRASGWAWLEGQLALVTEHGQPPCAIVRLEHVVCVWLGDEGVPVDSGSPAVAAKGKVSK